MDSLIRSLKDIKADLGFSGSTKELCASSDLVNYCKANRVIAKITTPQHMPEELREEYLPHLVDLTKNFLESNPHIRSWDDFRNLPETRGAQELLFKFGVPGELDFTAMPPKLKVVKGGGGSRNLTIGEFYEMAKIRFNYQGTENAFKRHIQKTYGSFAEYCIQKGYDINNTNWESKDIAIRCAKKLGSLTAVKQASQSLYTYLKENDLLDEIDSRVRGRVLRLSKSQYCKGKKCRKAIWLYNHRRDLEDPISDAKAILFRQGHEVGKLATECFPGGEAIEEDYTKPEEAVAHTKKALEANVPAIFEAAFKWFDVLVRVDILTRNSNGSFDLIEVKSTNSVKKHHLDDVAVQKYVVENSGLKVRSCFLMHLNRDYTRSEDIIPKKLFTMELVDQDMKEAEAEVPSVLQDIRTVLKSKEEPKESIGSKCRNPYDCEFLSYCWSHVNTDSIERLTRLSDSKREKLVAKSGIRLMAEIPDDFKLTEGQHIQVHCSRSKAPHIELSNLEECLASLKYPLYFLDYETVSYAIPQYPNTRPYLQLPFQYSLHVQKNPDGELEHREFLSERNEDPRKAFVERLTKDIPKDGGSIVVYHAAFERPRTLELAQAFEEHAGVLEDIASRMWDLEIPFAKKWYYDHRFEGSSSIKKVLPVVVPDLSYAELDIRSGDVAQVRYMEMIRGESPEAASALRKYCHLDTLAMVRILEFLRFLVSGEKVQARGRKA